MSATVLAFEDSQWNGPSVARDDDRTLARALEGEAKLLSDLLTVLERQRVAVAEDDVESVDATVFDAQRILLSLGQARRKRRSLLGLAAGNEGLPLSELPRLLGDAMNEDLANAISRVTRIAEEVQRQMTLNRQILSGAIRAGDDLLRAIGSGGVRPGGYSAPNAPTHPASPGGFLLNRKI